MKTHYSKSYPASRRRFGLFRGGTLIGAAVYSHPMSDKVLTNYFGGKGSDSLELGRFAISDVSDSFNAESYFFSICRKELKREGFRGIIAFSDDLRRTNIEGETIFSGHLGIFYGSCSGVYTGRSERTSIRLLPDGTIFSRRAISKIRNGEQGHDYASKILTSFGADNPPTDAAERRLWLKIWLNRLTRQYAHPGNHRYAFSLQKAIKLPKSLPYPKIKFSDLQLPLI